MQAPEQVTLLTRRQIRGDNQGNGQLQIMKDYGTKTGMSDLAVLLGGCMEAETGIIKIDTTSDNQRSGYVWSASSGGDGSVCTVDDFGDSNYDSPYQRRCGVRPALPSSVASSIRLSEAKPSKKISGVYVVEYGEYPQTIVSKEMNSELERLFLTHQLQATGKKYHFDGENSDAYNKPFSAKEYAEYQHGGKRYIRVRAKPYSDDTSVLSNGKTPKTGQTYWVEVQPIEWLKDPSGIMVARQALFAGVPFDIHAPYTGRFEETEMYKYLQNYFAEEMVPSREVVQDKKTHAPAKKPPKISQFTLKTENNQWNIETVQDVNNATATATIRLSGSPSSSDTAGQHEENSRLTTQLIKIALDKNLNFNFTSADKRKEATFTVDFPAQANFAHSVETALKSLGRVQRDNIAIAR